MSTAELDNPVINSPYDPPVKHFAIGPNGPTGDIVTGRRPSESFIPIPAPRKKQAAQQEGFDFDLTHERREENSLINDIRQRMELWRARGYPGATPVSRKLMEHWAAKPPVREDRALFCQREAAETAIYLAECAGKRGEPDFRTRLDEQNLLHNDGLPRIALKMATGTGKTVVMAMLIAWQTINKVTSPRDARFAKRFLIIAPGITIRDRLRVLQPSEEEENYYLLRDLVPADLWPQLLEAQVSITNYHTFLHKDAKEIKGVAANTRKLLRASKEQDAFRETDDAMVSRVLRDFMGKGKGELVVLNDEAHHCYQDKPITADVEEGDREDKQRNVDARVWFKGIAAIAKKVGVKAIYDLSATPFYLKGSGYNEGYIFPWVVSDFSLMDAIESGIVKVPRVPVDDDAKGDLPSYLNLWDNFEKGELPSKKAYLDAEASAGWVMPAVLQGALESLYRSYQRRFAAWEQTMAHEGHTPPVLIVVCPNTVVSKLVYDWIAGMDVPTDDGATVPRPGRLPLLANITEDGTQAARARTVLIDSAALESGEALPADFKKAAADEIDAFKAEYRRRNPGADVDKLTDEDLLREVMNTVGKKDKLGEHVRCVVSVAMLTEGWDANTVTHILGIRAFRSQLLCEQVVGRGLRRRSYAPNDEGMFDPEYAEIYGVPFAFIPSERPMSDPPPQPPATEVSALDSRSELEITFPKLDGYRLEVRDEIPFEDFGAEAAFHVVRDEVAVWVQSEGIVGAAEEVDLDQYRHARVKEVAFRIAAVLVHRFAAEEDVRHDESGGSTEEDEGSGTRTLRPDRPPQRPWLFVTLVRIATDWLNRCVSYDDDAFVGLLLPAQSCHRAAEHLFGEIVRQQGNQDERLVPLLRRFDNEGSTAEVRFVTRKKAVPVAKSHVSHVVLDGKGGNTWEEHVAEILDSNPRVRAFVKNDHLGLEVPYVHKGRSHLYLPDFLVDLVPGDDGERRTLIVEVSGGQKSPGPTTAKAHTTRDQWCTAVNNHKGWGWWGYIELTTMLDARAQIDQAITLLYAGAPIVGVPA